ncbi:MAG TPA: hypothetical protein DCY27_12975 [Desulfobacterales bacterium]|nr:hypothetical protein [Desulfobacterales bacterium]
MKKKPKNEEWNQRIKQLEKEVFQLKLEKNELTSVKERLKILFECAPDGYFLCDLKGRFLDGNTTAEELSGYKKEELIGKNFLKLKLLSPIQIKKAAVVLAKILKGHPIGPEEFSLNRKDGSQVELEIRAFPVKIKGKTTILAIARDITERKRADEALRSSDQKFRSIFEHMAAACCFDEIVYEDGKPVDYRIIDVNPAYEKIIGIAKSVAAGALASKLYGTGEAPFLDVYSKVAETGQAASFEAYFPPIKKDLNVIVSCPGIGGQFFTVFSDISERKQAEQQMLFLQDQLRQSQKMEAIGRLAGGVAHDFNNLLTAILGNIAMASLNADTKPFVLERLAEAEKACLRAQNLTRQLLTFSKGEKPRKKLASIGDLLKTSASLMLRSSNVRRQANIPEALWWAEVDEEQIQQAVNHLLINADQAMPQGGVIYIFAENLKIGEASRLPLTPGTYIKITIRDQGVGILPEHLDKVFDPFFTTKRRGSGLGLSTVYTIIKNHDGYITVESTPNGGATFTVYLPASQKKGPLLKETKLPLTFGRGKILLMDDEEMILEVSSAMLRRLGYEVTAAQDGAEAICLYQEAMEAGTPFDAVILDLTVPGGLGARETIGDLKQINPEAKVIVSSGFFDDPVMDNFYESGFVGIMPKPYNITQLSAMMHKIFQNPRPVS